MNKLTYIIKRLLLAFITGFIIISVTFILLKLIKEDPPVGLPTDIKNFYDNQVNIGYSYTSPVMLPNLEYDWVYQDSNTGVSTYYYSYPIMSQYWSWLSNIFTKWNWGTSLYIEKGANVGYIINKRLWVSVNINLITIIISIPLGIIFGIIAALKKNRPVDRVLSITNMIFISIPSFVFISLLVMIFGYGLKVLPTTWPQDTAPQATKVLGYIIPVLAGAFSGICSYQRVVRGELTEVMSSDFLLLARTKGLTKSQTVVRHALRNAMVPVLPSILASIVGVLGGSAILESIYSIPGIGQLFISAINTKDYNVLMMDMAVFTTIGLLAGIILDLSYGFLDPRIRMGEK